MASGIAFTRARDFHGVSGLMLVFIDGRQVAAVPYGGRHVFPLPPGIYFVQVAMGHLHSPPFQVDVWPGETSEVEGGGYWRGLFYWVNLVTVFVAPGRVYVVRPSPPSQGPFRRELSEVAEGISLFAGLMFLNVVLGLVGLLAIVLLA